MSKRFVVYGIQFDLDDPSLTPTQVQSLFGKSVNKAFRTLNDVYPLDYLKKNEADIIVNEMVRGRLEPYYNMIDDMVAYIREVHRMGYTYKEIGYLRSIELTFEEIKDYARMGYSIEDVLEDLGLDTVRIEAVPGVNTSSWKNPYLKSKGV